MMDLLIINGRYPDFQAAQIKKANIGVRNGKIVYLREDMPEAKKTLDAMNQIVSPGFIDIHMHEDDLLGEDAEYIIGNMMLKMGVTTACGGNCGIQRQRLAEFKDRVAKLGGSPVNMVMFAGYNQMRYELGLGHYERANEHQRESLRTLLEEELREGACGISFGIEYDPAITYDDMMEALALLKDKRYLASAHYRESGIGAIESIEEMQRLSKESGVKFQISHLSSCSATGQMEESLALIDKLISENPLLDFDTYPYNAFSTLIGSEVFEAESLNQWCEDISAIMLTKEPYKNTYCTKEILDEAREKYPDMMAVGFIMNEEEISAAISSEHGMIGSDGILFGGDGHPRASGTFPRVLGKYVREEKVISLLDALAKMTVRPADRLSLSDKGRIELGADADLTIFDETTIIDGATYENIDVQPEGISYVIIGGEIAMQHKEIVSDRLGRFISFHQRED